MCREHALLLHLALQAAGIANRMVYAKVIQDGHAEDHGFVLITRGPARGYTVDSFNLNFDGFKFSELVSPRGVGSEAHRAPWAASVTTSRRVLKINSFPRILASGGRDVADFNRKHTLTWRQKIWRIWRGPRADPP